MAMIQRSAEFTEDRVADGFENFCASQDFPNNIQLLVVKESQLISVCVINNKKLAIRKEAGTFTHCRISSKAPRTIYNDLFSVNYIDRDVRKDMPKYHRSDEATVPR